MLFYYLISTKINKEYFKRVIMKYRLYKSIRRLNKLSQKLQKAREERIWIENSPEIHLVNYPYHKLKRELIKVCKG